MKKILTIVLFVVSSFLMTAEPMLVDGIAAKVNNESILISDVLMMMQPYLQEVQSKYAGARLDKELKKLYDESIDSLIDRQVILDAYELQDSKLPQDVINNRINEIIFERFQGNKEQLIKTLAQDRLTYNQWKQEVTDQFIVMVMRNSNVNSKVNLSPSAMKEYYDEHKDEYRQPEKVLISMIYIEKTADKSVEAKKKERVFEIQKRLLKGESFASLAKEYSEDSSAVDGGDLGWMEPKMLLKDVSNVITNMTVGQVSDPIETEDNIYIVQLNGVKKESVKPFAEVEQDVQAKMTQEAMKKLYKEWITSLKETAYIKKNDIDLFD